MSLLIWIGVVNLIMLALVVVSGTVAYWFKSRQLRAQGEKPPPFLKFLFFPRGVPKGDERIPMPRALRLVLGAIFLAGGACFILFAGLPLVIHFDRTRSDPFMLVVALLVCACLGAAIGYVGFRLIVVKNDEPLFKRLRQDKPS